MSAASVEVINKRLRGNFTNSLRKSGNAAYRVEQICHKTEQKCTQIYKKFVFFFVFFWKYNYLIFR